MAEEIFGWLRQELQEKPSFRIANGVSKRARKNYLLFFEAKRDGENANFFGGLIQDEQWEPNWEEEQSAGKCRRNHWQRRLPCNE